jgi:BirA family biotin operon repressor/biotin-[acetyl-CoA-carboxylase] ligase
MLSIWLNGNCPIGLNDIFVAKVDILNQNSAYSLGNHVLHLGEVTSTNDLARQLLDEKIVHHGTFIRSDMQSKGRGQEQNIWESEKGANLLCSLILIPDAVQVDSQVYLNMSVCLALRDMVQEYCPTRKVSIKWPNDVYVDDHKIVGVLIENAFQGSLIKHSIVGMGVNINQQSFTSAKACSLATITQQTYDVAVCSELLLGHLKFRYDQWIHQQKQALWNDYHQYLYKKDVVSLFEIQGTIVSGMVKGIDEAGRLLLQVDGEIRLLNVKEVKWL